MSEDQSTSQLSAGNRLARRVGQSARGHRFALWGGFLGALTLLMVWFALSSVEDQSFSVRSDQHGQTTGDASRHAYAYQGLARLLRADGLGGQTVYGNSPLGSAGLRILLEPDLLSGDQEARMAFRTFLTQSKTPVLLVSSVRNSTSSRLRLNAQRHLASPIEKSNSTSASQLNADLGFPQSMAFQAGLSQGRVLGASVVVEDLVYFSRLRASAEVKSLDGRDFLYRQNVRQTPVYVLSDPDILNNAGLARGENAAFVLALISDIKQPGNVVFDNRDVRVGGSTGFSFIGRLFDWPLGIVSGSVLAFAVLLFWLAFGRFGPILREDPFLAAGKETALEAAVVMLSGTGNNREILRRYFEGQTRQMAAHLGGPKTGDLVRLQTWLDAVAKRRGVNSGLRLTPIGNRLRSSDAPLSENQAASTAHTIHAFRKALVHYDT